MIMDYGYKVTLFYPIKQVVVDKKVTFLSTTVFKLDIFYLFSKSS